MSINKELGPIDTFEAADGKPQGAVISRRNLIKGAGTVFGGAALRALIPQGVARAEAPKPGAKPTETLKPKLGKEQLGKKSESANLKSVSGWEALKGKGNEGKGGLGAISDEDLQGIYSHISPQLPGMRAFIDGLTSNGAISGVNVGGFDIAWNKDKSGADLFLADKSTSPTGYIIEVLGPKKISSHPDSNKFAVGLKIKGGPDNGKYYLPKDSTLSPEGINIGRDPNDYVTFAPGDPFTNVWIDREIKSGNVTLYRTKNKKAECLVQGPDGWTIESRLSIPDSDEISPSLYDVSDNAGVPTLILKNYPDIPLGAWRENGWDIHLPGMKELGDRTGIPFGMAVDIQAVYSSAASQMTDRIKNDAREVVIHNGLYWSQFEPKRGKPDTKLLKDQLTVLRNTGLLNTKDGFKLRGHALVFQLPMLLPSWVKSLNGKNMQQAINDHIDQVFDALGDNVSEIVVVNEPEPNTGTDIFWNKTDGNYILDSFRHVKDVRPNVKTILGLRTEQFSVPQIKTVMTQLAKEGLMNFAGDQRHLRTDRYTTVPTWNMIPNDVGLKFLEWDADSSAYADQAEAEKRQADVMIADYLAARASGRLEGVTVWNVSDTYAWKDDPSLAGIPGLKANRNNPSRSAMFGEYDPLTGGFRVKPVYKKLQETILRSL